MPSIDLYLKFTSCSRAHMFDPSIDRNPYAAMPELQTVNVRPWAGDFLTRSQSQTRALGGIAPTLIVCADFASSVFVLTRDARSDPMPALRLTNDRLL